MPPQDAAEVFKQNDDHISCITAVTGITGTSFFTQGKGIYLPEYFLTCSGGNQYLL